MRRFRIIHYTPNPMTGAQVPIAALVEGERGTVEIARSRLIPGPSCLGSRGAWDSIQRALDDLQTASEFDALPHTLGPFVRLSDARVLPASVVDPSEWVVSHILPKPSYRDEDQQEHPHGPRRATWGTRFFVTHRVAAFVKQGWAGGDVLRVNSASAKKISHWVPGKQELLLMEPVLGNRADLKEELRDISQTFATWRTIFQNRGVKRMPKFIAYVLLGGKGDPVVRTREALREVSAEVVDVEQLGERDRFLGEIRRVGQSAGEQGGLVH